MSCLSTSEYITWLGLIKDQYNDVLKDEYVKWLKGNRGSLFDKLKGDFIVKAREHEISENDFDAQTVT